MGKRILEFCGAFNGKIAIRANETPEQARERAELLMQSALDRVRSVDAVVGVDASDFTITEES